MWDLAVREEDYDKADSLLRRKFTPEKLPLGHRALMAIVRRDSAGLTRLLDEMEHQAKGHPFAAEEIARYLNDLPAARAFAQAALQSPRPKATRDSVHQFLALLELAQGRWSAARSEFAQAERWIPSAQRLHALSATWPFMAVPDSELAALRTDLQQWDPGVEPPEPNPGLAFALRPHLRLYLLGLLSSRLRDDAEALDYARQLARAGAPPEAMNLIRDLAQTIRAEVAQRQGRVAEALKMLEQVKGEMPPEILGSPFFSEEGSRYLRAELLYRLGRQQDALRWFSTAFQGTPNELVYLAPSHLRQAEIYDRLGDRQQAVDHYGRFVHLWKSCDPELRPSVDRAKARLEALVAEPR
jgi:tetratricopeptide (TPR) repeat protein